LGLALIQSGEAAEARRCLEKAVRNSPNLFEAHLHLGELLLTLGDAAAATTHLKRAAESPDAKVRKIANDLAAENDRCRIASEEFTKKSD